MTIVIFFRAVVKSIVIVRVEAETGSAGVPPAEWKCGKMPELPLVPIIQINL
jgi:hypothetical protein